MAETDQDGWNKLFWHVERGEEDEALSCLEKMPELLHARDVRGLTVLHVAAWRGRTEFIRTVVEDVGEFILLPLGLSQGAQGSCT